MAMSNDPADQKITTMTGVQMSSSSSSSEGAIISKGRATSEPIDIPQRQPPPEANANIGVDSIQPEQRTPSSTPESASSNTDPLFFILEEIQSTSESPTLCRPPTIRAAFLDKATAQTAMELLVYECGDPPAARRVICHDVFRDGQLLGEGYEYHTRSLLWRTLWIQEGFQEEDMEVEVSDDESEETEGEDGGVEDEEAPTVRIQGGGARLSGGGWPLPSMSVD